MRTFIVLISIDISDSRNICETIEDLRLNIGGSVQATENDVKNAVIEHIIDIFTMDKVKLGKQLDVWNISDFMDYTNNQGGLDEYYMSYVFA